MMRAGSGSLILLSARLMTRRCSFCVGLLLGCEGQGVGLEVFEPEGEVEFAGGDVAGGDEAKNGLLKLEGELGEPVAGAGAGDGFELVEAEPVVEGDRVGSAG